MYSDVMVTLQVPEIGYEEHWWEACDDGMTGRRRRAAASGEYRSAMPARLLQWVPSLSIEQATDLEEATRALSRFDAHARARLGPENPSLGPMSAVLLRTESTSSSQIENLTVGARQLALAELDQSTSSNAQVVAANVRAMEAALRLAEELDHSAILEMQRVLVSAQPGWESAAGGYRDQLVWVGASAISPVGAVHVAPEPHHVSSAMEDLLAFVRRLDLPPLLHAAIAHAQFETIHPFSDGNGRTGRALVHAMLLDHGVLTSTTAPLSAGLLRGTAAYFDALTAYRAGDAGPIVEQFIDAAHFAARSGEQLVDRLVQQLQDARDLLSGVRKDARAWTVLPHLVAHPVIDAAFLKRRFAMNDVTAQRVLARLVERGVLVEASGRRRHRVYHHPGILAVLDDYARQLRRG